jgi:hypothetical protein
MFHLVRKWMSVNDILKGLRVYSALLYMQLHLKLLTVGRSGCQL